ncbi:MAG: DUF4832 domain-containing protein [Dysgonamonadaceae bacterium]|jgi:hypothetical protein|nr:DUF4832 domain-containing protein [Dysgonamonadaceae bacterium]
MKKIITLQIIITFCITCLMAQEKLAIDITGRWDTIRTLLNPDKGWYHHYMDNSLTNYGLESEAELDTFPSVHHLFIRIPWAALEPEEGQFRWETIDTIVSRWAPKGYKLSLDITCKETMGEEMLYATPQWVEKAGAKGYMVNSWGTINWEPDYNDPVFLNKLDNFHRQMAERYDGAEWLSDVTTGSIGEWGEGHSLHNVGADVVIKHIDILLNRYKKTQIIIGDDYLVNGKSPDETLILRDYVKKKKMSYRDDSIFWEDVIHRPGSLLNRDFFEDVWRVSPTTLEFCHYSYYKYKYWNVPDGYGGGLDTAKAAIRGAHATFVSVHGHLREWQKDNPKAAWELVNLMGYWLFPQSMEAKWKHNRLGLSINWYNKGVAPAYTPYKLKIVLIGNDNREITLPAVSSGNEKWLPGVTKENYTIETPPLHSGVYQVKIQLYKEFRNGSIRPVQLGLATQYEDAESFYHIGNITL